MNGFQILDQENNPILIKELDKQAAEFWNKDIDSKHYANPSPKETNVFYQKPNWFDVIGRTIANKGNYTTGWHNVINDLISETLGQCFIDFNDKTTIKVTEFEKSGETTLSLPEETEIKLYHTLNYYRPYIQLINHWMSKGYQPKQILSKETD